MMFLHLVFEHLVKHLLVCSVCILESERYDMVIICSLVCDEGCMLLIFRGHLVVS